MGLLLLLIIGILAGGYLVLFCLSNTQPVSLDMLGGWYLHEVALWQIVVVALAIGLVVAVVLMLPAQWKMKSQAKAYKRELGRAQALLEGDERRVSEPSLPQSVVKQEEPSPEPTETVSQDDDSSDSTSATN